MEEPAWLDKALILALYEDVVAASGGVFMAGFGCGEWRQVNEADWVFGFCGPLRPG